MTFEEFSMSVHYPNRGEQFYKYYEHHVALFRLMCQYMNASSGFEISFQEKENGRISYFITCRGPAADFTMLAARINHNVVPCMINNHIFHAQVTLHSFNMIEVEFV